MRSVLLVATAAILLAGMERAAPEKTWLGSGNRPNDRPTFEIDPAGLQGRKLFDSYKVISSNDEKARLDNFAIELQGDPSTRGYIIVFGRRTRPGEAKKRADRAKQYLWYSRGVGTERLVSLDHCFRLKLEVELWIVQQGAAPPVPCPVKVKPRTGK